MSFSDLLKQPLPSRMHEEDYRESGEDILEDIESFIENTDDDSIGGFDDSGADVEEGDFDDGTAEESSDDYDEYDDYDDYDDVEDDLDDIDLDDLSDDDIDEIEDDIQDSDAVVDDFVNDEPVKLTADEEREADDMMCLAGTTELLKSELNTEERASFLESPRETQIAVYEGFLLESDVSPYNDYMTEAKMYNKTMVHFSKDARKKQLYAVALNVSARAHNDPDYLKLQKVQKVRRVLKKKIEKKYHAEAVKRMKVYYNKLKSSKSQVLSSLGKKISK